MMRVILEKYGPDNIGLQHHFHSMDDSQSTGFVGEGHHTCSNL